MKKPEKYATVFRVVGNAERNDLLSKLREDGFTLPVGTYPITRIYHPGRFSSGKGTGYLVHHSEKEFHLYVYEENHNPLEEFVRKNYGL